MGREYMGIIRTTFIVDESGVITDIIEKVKTKDHANQIIQ
jgi:peroxiredoxin Q/BCP